MAIELKNISYMRSRTNKNYIERYNQLENISIALQQGEIYGLLGKCNAGKSDLLMIISGAIKPNGGEYIGDGNSSPIIGADTVFDDALTVRDNIYMYSSLLMISKEETASDINELLSLCNIDSADILLRECARDKQILLNIVLSLKAKPSAIFIDDVINILPLDLRRKCIALLQSYADNGGITVIASKDAKALNGICTEGIWLENGTVKQSGEYEEISFNYIKSCNDEVDLQNRSIIDTKVIENTEKTFKSRLPLILSSVFLCFTFCVFAPLEMYLGNLSEFWFTIEQFWWIPICVFAISTIGLYAIGSVLHGAAYKVYTGAVFGTGLAVYIQGNFLNANLGELNGASVQWHNYKISFFINAFIFLAIIIIPALLALLPKINTKKTISAVAALLTLMQLSTLCVLFGTAKWDNVPEQEGFVSYNGFFEVAKEKNVIVLLLDMFDDDYLKALLVNEPQLTKELDGFTHFTNITGSYPSTLYAVPTFLTNNWMYNDDTFLGMIDTNFKKASQFNEMIENGYRINLFTPEAYFPEWMNKDVYNYVDEKPQISSYKSFTYLLYRFAGTKYLPNIAKPLIWMNGTEFNALKRESQAGSPYYEDNGAFRELVNTIPFIVNEAENQFSFIHIAGAHYPYMLDEKGDSVEKEVDKLVTARGVLQLGLNYLDKIKKLGRYDDATVIMMADHGIQPNGVISNPLMLIKPSKAKGEMKTSNAPVSQMDFTATYMSDIGLNDDGKYGKSMFEYKEGDKRDRRYYGYTFIDKTDDMPNIVSLTEYKIDDADNKLDSFHLTGVKYSKVGEKTVDNAKN
ncbi:MAG: sulfatase-like hydrolase/transferase [Oscillospiraceae bacterium]